MPRATNTTAKNSASNDMYYAVGHRRAIRSFVFYEMMRGAGWAGLVVVGIVGLMLVIYWTGLLLPEDSKNAPPPMPFSQVAPESDTLTRLV